MQDGLAAQEVARGAIHLDRADRRMSDLPPWPPVAHTFTAPTERQHRVSVPFERRDRRVLAIVQAHADDLAFLGAGTVARMIREEGFDAYLIQTTNDDKCGPTPSIGETVAANERDVAAIAQIIGIQRTFFLGYSNHFLDAAGVAELRARLVLLFRLLRPDVVMTFNPSPVHEENPDHWVTGQAVAAARWMAGLDKDYPEQLAAGLAPHVVRGRMYWTARAGQPMNRVIDVSDYAGVLVDALVAHQSQGTAGAVGRRLRAYLAARGLSISALGDDENAADRAYVETFMLDAWRRLGASHGVDLAEGFVYEDDSVADAHEARVAAWVAAHAAPSVTRTPGSTMPGPHDDHNGAA